MSFRLKTILGIALIELTVMAILIGINQFALGGSASTQLYERAEATARVFANAVSDAVIATDLATLDATVATAMETEDITYLRVRSPSGFVLSEAGDAEICCKKGRGRFPTGIWTIILTCAAAMNWRKLRSALTTWRKPCLVVKSY